MNVRSTLGVAASLIATLALAPALSAQEEEAAEKQDHQMMTTTLESKNDSGITGTAVLAHAAGAEATESHSVTLELSGVEAGQTYAAHVHSGTCETGGGVVTALTSVAAEGELASSTTVLTPDQLAKALEAAGEPTEMAAEGEEEAEHPPLFIQVHLPDGTPAACGNVHHGEKKPEGR